MFQKLLLFPAQPGLPYRQCLTVFYFPVADGSVANLLQEKKPFIFGNRRHFIFQAVGSLQVDPVDPGFHCGIPVF